MRGATAATARPAGDGETRKRRNEETEGARVGGSRSGREGDTRGQSFSARLRPRGLCPNRASCSTVRVFSVQSSRHCTPFWLCSSGVAFGSTSCLLGDRFSELRAIEYRSMDFVLLCRYPSSPMSTDRLFTWAVLTVSFRACTNTMTWCPRWSDSLVRSYATRFIIAFFSEAARKVAAAVVEQRRREGKGRWR